MRRSRATCALMNGSCAMTFISNARARRATSWPMRPSPARPSVLPRTSSPRKLFLSHLPCFIDASAAGIFRASASTQRHRQFRDADAVGARRVHDDDAARAGGVDVDVVDAGAGARDRAKPRRGGDQIGGHFRGAAHDDGVGVGEIGGQVGRRAAAARIDGPAFGAQEVERRGREVVGDDDFHHGV